MATLLNAQEGERVQSPQERRFLALNEAARQTFVEQAEERKSYYAALHAEVGLEVCIDGRARSSRHMGIPFGVAFCVRRAGGHVSLGSAVYRDGIERWVDQDPARPNILFHVLHYSSECEEHGCGYWMRKGGLAAAVRHAVKHQKKLHDAYPDQLYVPILRHDTEDNSYAVLDPAWAEEAVGLREPQGRWVPIYGMAHALQVDDLAAGVRLLFKGWPDPIIEDLIYLFDRSTRYAAAPSTCGLDERHKAEDTIVVGGGPIEQYTGEHVYFPINESGGSSSKQIELAVMMVMNNALKGVICQRHDDRVLLVAQLRRVTDPDPVRDEQLRKRAQVAAIELTEKLLDISRGKRERDAPFTVEEKRLFELFASLPKQIMAVLIGDDFQVEVVRNESIDPVLLRAEDTPSPVDDNQVTAK